LCTYRTIKRY